MIFEETSPFQSISDWISRLPLIPDVIRLNSNIDISKKTCALLSLAVKGISPIHVISVHWRGGYYPVSSVEELNIYYQFVRNNLCVVRSDWSIHERFPSVNNRFCFQELDLSEQQCFMMAKVSGCCYYASSEPDLVLLQDVLTSDIIGKILSYIY